MALALSVGGHLATPERVEAGASCRLASRPDWADRVIERMSERIRPHAVAQRVALALLGRVLHGTCS